MQELPLCTVVIIGIEAVAHAVPFCEFVCNTTIYLSLKFSLAFAVLTIEAFVNHKLSRASLDLKCEC